MSKLVDLTGQKFGRLTALYYNKEKHLWHCKCDCGNEKDIKAGSLKNGYTTSCGCYNKQRISQTKINDLTNKRFGRLLVIKKDHSDGKEVWWLCKCDCGNQVILKGRSLWAYGTKSCGCLRSETTRNRMRIDLTNQQFTNLTVIKRDEQTSKWLCRCKCGKELLVKTQDLTTGVVKGCGCEDIAAKTMIKKGYENFKQNYKDYVIPLFNLEQYEQYHNDHFYEFKWKCVKCGQEFKQHRHSTGFNKDYTMLPRCPKCYPIGNKGYSQYEVSIRDFIKQIYKGQIIENDRKIIKPYELDIVLPQIKVAIEINGDYWHCAKFERMTPEFHLMKTEKCLQKGYKLIHLFVSEIIFKEHIIKQKLKSIICNNIESIYARNCQIKQIEAKESKQFLNKNHIQGADNAKVKLGLFNNNQLVAVMTFCKPRFTKKYDYELSRYATSKRVIGGAGKLLKYFRDHYNGSIITYCDRRFSIGNMYQKIGFKLDHISKPNYWYFTNKHNILTRYQCQKHKLKKLLGEEIFDPNLSEEENMKKIGGYRVYDCGNLVYTIT